MKDMMWWMRQSGRELSQSPPAGQAAAACTGPLSFCVDLHGVSCLEHFLECHGLFRTTGEDAAGKETSERKKLLNPSPSPSLSQRGR